MSGLEGGPPPGGASVDVLDPPLAPPLPPPAAGTAWRVPAPASARAEGARGSGATRIGRWVQPRAGGGLVLGAVLVVIGIVHGVGMTGYPAPVDDEGTYMAEAWAVQLHHALTPYTYWYDHPPLGWIQIAGFTWATDGFRSAVLAVDAGRLAMLVAFLVAAGLLFVLARRLGLSRAWAAVAVLAFGLSPLAVEYQRMVYLDNVAIPWLLGAFVLALSPRRHLWVFAASGACFAAAVLSKETVLVFAPALVWLALRHADRSTRAFCVTAQCATGALLIAGYPLFALLRGELIPGPGHVSLLGAVRFQLLSRAGSGDPLSPGTPAHSLIMSWLHTDPWLLGLGAAAVPVGLAWRPLRPVAVAMLLGLAVMFHGGYLPVPYVIGLLPFAALLVAGTGQLTQRGLGRLARQRRRIALPGLALSGAVILAVVTGAAAAILPLWTSGIATAMTANQMGPTVQAEHWIERHVHPGRRLLVDDTMWVDLVDHGFNRPLEVVWFYKLGSANNLDPSVARHLPGGWRDFSYVVSTPSMRAGLAGPGGDYPQVKAALAHSTAVAVFGRGPSRIVIRRITVPGRHARATRPPRGRPQ